MSPPRRRAFLDQIKPNKANSNGPPARFTRASHIWQIVQLAWGNLLQVACFRKHGGDLKFEALPWLEKVRVSHDQCLLDSLNFLQHTLRIAKEVVEVENELDTKEAGRRAVTKYKFHTGQVCFAQ